MTPQANVDVVRGMFQALGEGDFAAVLDCWDPRGDYYPVAKWPEAQPRHGSEEIREFLVAFHQSFERVDFAIEEIEPVADDRVFMRLRLAGEGRASGVSLDGEIYFCFWLRHGQVFRQEDHLTLPGARRALGLSESP